MQKRGQAALEFMMTYGWAILIVIVAISALSYFGVLRADRFLPDSCFIGPGISCLSHKATTDTLDIVLQNQLGQDILVTAVRTDGCEDTTATSMNRGDKVQFTLTDCSFGSAGKKIKQDINFTYRDEELIYHTRSGEFTTTVEG